MSDPVLLHSPRARSGAAMIVAVSMVAAVGVALVLIGRLTVLDAKRTHAEAVDAQLRLMLLAGKDWTLANADALQAGSQAVPLPSSLAEGSVTINVDASGLEDRRRIEMTAMWLDRTQSQSLIYAKEGAAWLLINAELQTARSATD